MERRRGSGGHHTAGGGRSGDYKTSICKFWQQDRWKGSDCNFAHGQRELQSHREYRGDRGRGRGQGSALVRGGARSNDDRIRAAEEAFLRQSELLGSGEAPVGNALLVCSNPELCKKVAEYAPLQSRFILTISSTVDDAQNESSF